MSEATHQLLSLQEWQRPGVNGGRTADTIDLAREETGPAAKTWKVVTMPKPSLTMALLSSVLKDLESADAKAFLMLVHG